MSVLKLSMKQNLVQQSLPDNGVVANILFVGDENPEVRKGKSHRNVIIPVNDANSDYARHLDLDPGHYVIQAALPTGELIARDIDIPKDGSDVEVRIHSEHETPHEWLGWHNFLGNVQTSEPEPEMLEPPLRMAVPKGFDLYRHRRLRYRKLPDDRFISDTFDFTSPVGFQQDTGLKLDELVARAGPLDAALSGQAIWHHLRELITAAHDPVAAQNNLGGVLVEPAGRDNDFALFRLAAEGPLPLFKEAKYPVDYVGNDLQRLYMTLSCPSSLRLVSLPIPWPQIDHSGEAVTEIMVPASGVGDVIDSSLAITDREVGSALGYLTAGDLTAASTLFNRAKGMLFEKMTNPCAAAVGGYVMLKTAREPGPWMDWIENLMNWFDWLPDGAILNAWLKMDYQQNDVDLQEAHDALLLAIDRGLPLCSLGIGKLVELLRSFAADDPVCAERLKLIQPVAWRTDMGEPFTTIDLIRG